MKPRLSISLLVSDRSETVSKCLDSLLPILKEIPSELIIVYTGIHQECLETAQKYTDQIFSFTWCNDFSAARNCGLEKAAGEWFLYIDDDEWFDDASEIVSFFKDGEYLNYESACYVQRNYIDLQGKGYEDVGVTRLVKLVPDLKFTGVIHERLSYVRPPEKMFSAFVHHYGYIQTNLENKNLRFERNVFLLKKEIEKEPEDARNYLQLAQEYFSEGIYSQAELYCKIILDQFKNTEETYCLDWAEVFLVDSVILQKREEEALKSGLDILAAGRIGEAAALFLMEKILPLCVKQQRYSEGNLQGERFLHLWDYLESNSVLWQKQQILIINRNMILKGSFDFYKHALVCAAHEEKYNTVIELLRHFPWKDREMEDEVCRFLEWWKNEFEERKKELLNCLFQVKDETHYLFLQKALWHEQNMDRESAYSEYNWLAASEKQIIQRESILLALRQGFSVLPFVRFMDLVIWKELIKKTVAKLHVTSFTDYVKRIETTFGEYPVYQLAAEQILLAGLITDESMSEEDFNQALHRYCEKVIKLNRHLFRQEMFETKMWFCLPLECRIALAVSETLGWIDGGDYKRSVDSLKKMTKEYPGIAGITRRLIQQVSVLLQEEAKGAEGQEFMRLAMAVKQNLRELMEAKRYREAYAVAEQLYNLLPGDLEVARWRQEILGQIR